MKIKIGTLFTFQGKRFKVTRVFGSKEENCWVAKSGRDERWFTEEEILNLV